MNPKSRNNRLGFALAFQTALLGLVAHAQPAHKCGDMFQPKQNMILVETSDSVDTPLDTALSLLGPRFPISEGTGVLNTGLGFSIETTVPSVKFASGLEVTFEVHEGGLQGQKNHLFYQMNFQIADTITKKLVAGVDFPQSQFSFGNPARELITTLSKMDYVARLQPRLSKRVKSIQETQGILIQLVSNQQGVPEFIQFDSNIPLSPAKLSEIMKSILEEVYLAILHKDPNIWYQL